MNSMMYVGAGAVVTLVVGSIYNLLITSIRRRVTVRSPEAKAIAELVPAVNALIESNGPMMQGIIAILEAQKGICNGNIDEALRVNHEAKRRFDAFLLSSAKVAT
jgi:hypothetical protein